MAITRDKAILTGIIGIAGLFLVYFSIVVLTPTFGKIVGYANHQPLLHIIQRENPSPQEDVERILHLAQKHFDKNPNYRTLFWSEPSVIEEQPNCWRVAFAAKIPIYSFCGLKQTFHPSAPAMFVSIEKSNLNVRFGPWCQ